MKIPGYADAMKLAQKTTQKEVEEIDEISKEKTQKYLDRALDSHSDLNMARRNTSGDAQKEFARKEKLRKQGISRAVDRLTKEEVELVERTYNDDDLYSIHKDTKEIKNLGNPYRSNAPEAMKREMEAQGHKVVRGRDINLGKVKVDMAEEEQFDEATLHPMAVHVQRVPGKMKNGQEVYKVHAVGSKVTAVKPGEHLNDTELDDATETGHKIKMMREEKQPMTPPFEPGKTSKPVTPGKYGQEVSKVKHLAKQAMPKTQKEEVEEIDQTIIEHNSFDIELPETLRFGDYLTAAKKLVESEDDAIAVANEFFKNQDESLVIESFTRADIEDKVKAHSRAGHEVSMPKYSTKEGKPYAEYTVTNKETGKKTKYIHHGSTRRVVT